jgi:hypothetical protein
MNRRNFMLNSLKGLAGLTLTGCSINKLSYLDYEGIKETPNEEILNFNSVEEFQEIKIKDYNHSLKYIAQKIKDHDKSILPFIFKDKENKDFYFQRIKTPQREFAREMLIYEPYEDTLDISSINPQTIVSENVFPRLIKGNKKVDSSIRLSKKRMRNIFMKDYLYQGVSSCYKNDPLKTNFYLIPLEDITIKKSDLNKNIILTSTSGIYRGFSLNNLNFSAQEKPYKLTYHSLLY